MEHGVVTQHAGLLVCGWEEVFLLEWATPDAPPRKSWSWTGRACPGLPEPFRGKFDTTDECKPVDGRRILITSSGGAAALVRRDTGEALFWAGATNAHSAALLPGERVVVAASSDRHGATGDRVLLFDLSRPDEVLFEDSLPAGHGAVWDEPRETLWALADHELRAYRLSAWDTASPALLRAAEIPLPEAGGHDLYPVPGTDLLSITTARHVWLFDGRAFLPHPVHGDQPMVKSVAVDPATGRTAFIQAESPHWWADRIHFLAPGGVLHLPGERLYKARWLPTNR